MVKNLPANAGNTGEVDSTPGWGQPPGEGNGNSLQYCCLESPMDRGAWQATVHRVAKSQAQLSAHTHTHTNRHKDRESEIEAITQQVKCKSPLEHVVHSKIFQEFTGCPAQSPR